MWNHTRLLGLGVSEGVWGWCWVECEGVGHSPSMLLPESPDTMLPAWGSIMKMVIVINNDDDDDDDDETIKHLAGPLSYRRAQAEVGQPYEGGQERLGVKLVRRSSTASNI